MKELRQVFDKINQLSYDYHELEPDERTLDHVMSYFYTDLCSRFEEPDEELKMVIEAHHGDCDFSSEFCKKDRVLFEQLKQTFVDRINQYHKEQINE